MNLKNKEEKFRQLSKEQKVEMILAAREKKRRSRVRRKGYKPHKGQEKVIKSKARNVNLFCGNGWGKTTTGSNVAMWIANGYNPVTKEYTTVPAKIHIILDHPSKVEETWLPEMRKWFIIDQKQLKKNGKPHYNEITFPNGSRIIFMFHEQPELVFESTQFEVIIFDEPPPRNIYIAMKRGQREIKKKPKTYILGTPIYQPWMRTEIYDRWEKGELPNTECFFGTTEENMANLSQEWYDDFVQYLTEEEKEARLRGSFFAGGTLALRDIWNRELHITDQQYINEIWEDHYPCIVAIDPHPSKKHHAVLIGATPKGELFVLKEIAEKLVAKEFAILLKEWYKYFRIIDIVVDSLGSADGTGNDDFKSFISVLNENKVPARATRYKEKNEEDFVDRIKTALAIPKEPDNFGFYTPKMRIVETCTGVIKDIENVQWQIDKATKIPKPKLEISDKDYLACVKYGLAAGLNYRKDNSKSDSYIPKNRRLYGLGA